MRPQQVLHYFARPVLKMKGIIIMKGLLIVIVFIMSAPGFAWAGSFRPLTKIHLEPVLKFEMLKDTVPTPAKTVAVEKAGPAPVAIKTLPVPRRQPIPVPVKVKVVPVKIKTPKVVKPIIKLLP